MRITASRSLTHDLGREVPHMTRASTNSVLQAPVKNGIIAKGETTGHAHRMSPSSMAQGALLSHVGRSMFLRSPEAGATIVHDEHGPLELPAGSYAVVLQREFDGLRWRQ